MTKILSPLLACIATPCLLSAETTFFAFDDENLGWQHNLKLTLETAEKHPANPVMRAGAPGSADHGHAILYGTVMKQDDTFRMWYLGMHEIELEKNQAPGWWRPMCYAESKDGVTWTKPELGLVELNGDKKNNICLIEGEVHSMTRVNDFLSVLHDPEDPDPARRYKCAFIAHMPFDDVKGGRSKIGPNESRWGSFITATSADGLRWRVSGERPVNAGGERFEVTGLYRFGGFYYATGQLIHPWAWRPDGQHVGRVMLTYRSADFIHWSQAKALAYARPEQLVTPPVSGSEMHMGAGIWNRGNVLVGLHGMWQAPTPPPAYGSVQGVRVDVGLVISNDGVRFREPQPGHAIIPRGPAGAWDEKAILQGHAFINEGDKTMIWYSHWDTDQKLKNMHIGLATLRRDGFGHLSPQVPENDAHVITSPFAAQNIALNVDGITPDAPLTLQLLDPQDRPLSGQSVEIRENGIEVPVAWPKPLPAGQKVALRIHYPVASKARLYAVYIR